MRTTSTTNLTTPASWRRLRLAVLAVVAVVLTSSIALATPAEALTPSGVASGATPNRAQYLGRWNYNQPDRRSMRNIAVIQCPAGSTDCIGPGPGGGPLEVPQVGDLVLTEGTDGGVVGRTDQGCTWHFAVRPRSLELSPASQFCFNEVIGSGYTITSWMITVHGNHERETIRAVSHNPTGDDDFVLTDGRRTRAPERARPGEARRFLGTWEYTPADPQSRVNIAIYREGEQLSFRPQIGLVNLTTGRRGTVVAHTAEGCRWTLVLRGNTAQLAPAVQVCERADSAVSLTHWTIATDGRRQATVMSGTVEAGGSASSFVLGIGDLIRQRP